jgi:hypothetical protein
VWTVASDIDLEERLRGALLDHADADGLPEHVLVGSLVQGRSSLRRRRRLTAAGAVASLALVGGLAVAVGAHDGSQPQPAPAPPKPSPSPSEGPDTTTLGNWAASLPHGAPAEVPYLAGTTVVEPGGSRIDVQGTEASVVGQTVAGLVLLVGTETQQPYSFTSRYVLVRPDGEVADLPVPTLVAEGAQEAVVSPDGTEFTGGGDILDMYDLSVVGRVPDEADILIAWTPVGIVYYADDHYKLWREGEAPIALGSNPGVFATGSEVAIDQCGTIARLKADGTLTRISPHCVLGAWSVSPSGRWAVTAALQLVSVSSGHTRDLSDRPLLTTERASRLWWNGDRSVLIPAGDFLVRCHRATATCEQVAGPEKGLALP